MFITIKALVFLFVFLFLSSSAVIGSALTDLRVERELEVDQYYRLDTAIHCYYDTGSWFSDAWSSTECETTSDLFCYVWAKNIDRKGVEVFSDEYGYVENRLKLPKIDVASTNYASETWHGAYRSKNGVRNLDARIEIYDPTCEDND